MWTSSSRWKLSGRHRHLEVAAPRSSRSRHQSASLTSEVYWREWSVWSRTLSVSDRRLPHSEAPDVDDPVLGRRCRTRCCRPSESLRRRRGSVLDIVDHPPLVHQDAGLSTTLDWRIPGPLPTRGFRVVVAAVWRKGATATAVHSCSAVDCGPDESDRGW